MFLVRFSILFGSECQWTYIVFILQCQTPQNNCQLSKKSIILIEFDRVLREVRAYTVAVSYRRSTWIRWLYIAKCYTVNAILLLKWNQGRINKTPFTHLILSCIIVYCDVLFNIVKSTKFSSLIVSLWILNIWIRIYVFEPLSIGVPL